MARGGAAVEKRAALKMEAKREAVQGAMPVHAERVRISAMHKEARRVEKMLRDKRASHTERKKIRETIDSEGTIPYIGDGPVYGFNPIAKAWNAIDPSGKLQMKYFYAAESMFGAFGSTGNRIFTQLQRAVDQSEKMARVYEGVFSTWSDTARRALGEGNRAWKNGFGKNLDSAHAWETGGEAGLRSYAAGLGRSSDDIESLVAVFKARKDFEWKLHQGAGRKIGGKGPVKLEEMGLMEYIPHASLDLSDDELATKLEEHAKSAARKATEEAYKGEWDRGNDLDMWRGKPVKP